MLLQMHSCGFVTLTPTLMDVLHCIPVKSMLSWIDYCLYLSSFSVKRSVLGLIKIVLLWSASHAGLSRHVPLATVTTSSAVSRDIISAVTKATVAMATWYTQRHLCQCADFWCMKKDFISCDRTLLGFNVNISGACGCLAVCLTLCGNYSRFWMWRCTLCHFDRITVDILVCLH